MSGAKKWIVVFASLIVSVLSTLAIAQDAEVADPCLETGALPQGVATSLECIQLPDPALAGATNFVPTVVLGGVAAVGVLLAGSAGPNSTPSTP